MRLLLVVALVVISPRDGSGYDWVQRCVVTPESMRCEWFSGPDLEK